MAVEPALRGISRHRPEPVRFSGLADPDRAYGPPPDNALPARAQGPVRPSDRRPGVGRTDPDRERGLAARRVRRDPPLVTGRSGKPVTRWCEPWPASMPT